MLPEVVVDSCVLIDFFRAKDKFATFFVRLLREKRQMVISTVVLFEVLAGTQEKDRELWNELFAGMRCVSFDERIADVAARLSQDLRKLKIQTDASDLFIAATALSEGLPLATLNTKHFEKIDRLEIAIIPH